ncbi:hypothetical protein JTB14_026003 [Gonioctena quinquepunctata]|nr:hypothetical protein JTB14_026003 [Gonioctena quinquepunctata]
MNHQTTMTDPFLNSGVHIKEQKDTKRIQRKKRIKKKVQLGTTSVKLTKKNIPIIKRISRCHRYENNKIPNKNEMEKKPSGGYQDEKINQDPTLHEEIQIVEQQDCMEKQQKMQDSIEKPEYIDNSSDIIDKQNNIRTSTLLDNIFINFENGSPGEVVTSALSDHEAQILKINNTKQAEAVTNETRTNKGIFSDSKLTQLRNELQILKWATLHSHNDPNEAYDYFFGTLKQLT